jgi:hypothetical protein
MQNVWSKALNRPVMDISTAKACNAVIGALVARERTGVEQSIEVSLFDNAVLMTGYATLQHFFIGKDPQRYGNMSPDTCPSCFCPNSADCLIRLTVSPPAIANAITLAPGAIRAAVLVHSQVHLVTEEVLAPFACPGSAALLTSLLAGRPSRSGGSMQPAVWRIDGREHHRRTIRVPRLRRSQTFRVRGNQRHGWPGRARP